MMKKAFDILVTAFRACTGWFTDLVNATGSGNIIVAAFGVVIVVGLLFIPLRGRNVVSWVGDYKAVKISNAKRKKP